MIRINPNAREKSSNGTKALYLDPQQLGRFQQHITATLREKGMTINNATLTELQQINHEIRGKDLAAWIA
ncbi:hypothetical protein [Erwinia typographi]|uniref:hypothetical protein n=1 Tax=Erwinia typographi TaxID=371042 RepID=UPI00068D08CE|nr:hypothetical protein [Erwinia typographi]